jgi:UDP-glucuronate decarboxylase
MDKKRILVCGAGGFIGSHLARELYRQGHFVRVIDLKYDGYLPEPYYSEKIRGDLRQHDTALHATQSMDWIFQLAADMGGIGYITEKAADVVYNNALINLNMAKAALYPNARIFFASSACIYPNYKQEDADVKPLAESDAMPADPNEAYGWEKLFSEIVYQSFARDYGLDIRIARFHNIYGPCYDEQTEVLTRNGFKPFNELAGCEEIATLNPDTGFIEYHIPTAMQRYHYKGNMVHFNSSRVDLLVTPEHNMYFTTHRGSRLRLGKASDCLGWQQVFMSRSVRRCHADVPADKVLEVSRGSDGRNLENKGGARKIISIDTWLRFLGWYLSEGSCFKTPSNYTVCITQKNEANRKQIIETIEDMGFATYLNGDKNILIHSKQLYDDVKDFGHSHDKYIPRMYLNLPQEKLQILFDALMAGDGNASGRRYTSASKQLADDVQEIALKLGYGSQINIASMPYRVCLTKEVTHRVDRNRMSEEQYNGTVYDVTVPNHIILVRRNGKVVWSGNCGTYDGGREKAPSALCRKVALADNPGIIEVWGDGKATRSFCYIDDCVNGIQALMESDWTEPINIGSDRLVTVDELAELAIAASGKDIQIRHDVSKPQGVRGRNADLTLVKQVLGWWPTISLEIGMDATYRWIAEQVKK